jgi:hypothetical protein
VRCRRVALAPSRHKRPLRLPPRLKRSRSFWSSPVCYSLFTSMAQSTGPASRFAFLQGLSLIFLVLFVPLVLSNHAEGTALGILVFIVMFFFSGYLLLTLSSSLRGSIRILLSPIFGIVMFTTAYDIFARASIAAYFPYLVAALSVGGMVLFVQQTRRQRPLTHWTHEGYETVLAGCGGTEHCSSPLEKRPVRG